MPFERFVDTMAPGALFVAGFWYLNRPFLSVYFPVAAGDLMDSGAFSAEARLIMFFLVAICCGTTVRHLSDVAIRLLVREEGSPKRASWRKRAARALFRIVSIVPLPDPRVDSVQRYLISPQRKWLFGEMVRDWAHSTPADASRPQEAVLIHQHLATRIRAIEGVDMRTVERAEKDMRYAASLLTASLLLIPVSLMAFGTSYLADRRILGVLRGESIAQGSDFLPEVVMAVCVLLVCMFLCYGLRRKVRDYFALIPTLALHCYDERRRRSE